MKISKRQLRRIIREEKSKVLNESRHGGVGVGFSGWEANKSADFAKAYGKDARVMHDFGSNAQRSKNLAARAKNAKLREQGELSAAGLQTYKVEMLVAIPPGAEEYILNSIEDGMEFDVSAGEGIIEYSVRQTDGGDY